LVVSYAVGRALFGAAALIAPATTGRALAGDGGAAPDAQAFLRGIGGREIGIALGLLTSARSGPALPWLTAGVLCDLGDLAGMLGAWHEMVPSKRRAGVAMAGAAALVGSALAVDSARRER
jgi:hypothetical protein